MSNKPQSRRLLLIILLAVLLVVIGAGLYYWQSIRLRKARLEATNPVVYIDEPGQGFTAKTGSWIPVVASSTGVRLIHSIEIWINGELIEIQESGFPGGVGVIYGHFPLLVQEGAQTFVVRAVDVDGFIGQSDPVSITGYSSPERDQAFSILQFGPDTDLERIAFENQISVDELFVLNPDIHTQSEGILRIPIDPAEENTPVSPDQIPQEIISKSGYVNGKICYPSQYIPAMTAYFENTASGHITTLPIALNQNTYGIALPPGSYRAFAWLPDFSLGGSYSKAVSCGLTTSCTDHSPIEFQVAVGSNTKGVDICDWYDLKSVPAAPDAPINPVNPVETEIATDIPMLSADKVFPAKNNASLPFAVVIPFKTPGVPEHFSATNDQCKIRIGWDTPNPVPDGYAVWLTSQTGVKQLAAKLESDEETNTQAWYEFTSPLSGLVSVWVEAYNAIGSTASTIKTLKLPSECNTTPGDDLELQALELNVAGEFDNVYLYLSVEGIPEERLPADDSTFLAVQEGSAGLISGGGNFTLPKPKDGTLTISGECWGWAGDTPEKISSFSESIPESSWSGFNKEVGNQNCGLNLNLKRKEDINSYQTMSGKSTKIMPPYDVKSEQNRFYEHSIDPSEEWSWFWEREISWKWQGPKDSITGFTIYHNGKKIATAPVTDRSATVVLPSWCGEEVRWRVVANGKKGQSPSSPITKEQLPHCGKYAEVVFDRIHLYKSCDSCCCGGWANDTYEAYFDLVVNDVSHPFGSQDHTIPISSGTYYFKSMAVHSKFINPEKFLVLIPKEPIQLKILGNFYDYDSLSADDRWGWLLEYKNYSTFKDALNSVNNPQGGYQPYGKQYMNYANGNEVYYRIWFYTSK
jgi:hypothetical protein